MTDVYSDLEYFICQVDSDLWESLSMLTQSRTERTDTHLRKRTLITAYLLSLSYLTQQLVIANSLFK